MSEHRAAGVDVNAIMAEVAEEVRRKRQAGDYPPDVLVELDIPSLDTGDAAQGRLDAEAVSSALADMQRSSHFTALITTESKRPVIAPVIAGARRAIRTSLSWYMNGILQQVSKFAEHTVRTMGALSERTAHLEGRISGLEDHLERVDQWQAKVDEDRLPERLSRLDRALRDLRTRLEEGVAPAGTSGGEPQRAGAWSWKAERSFDYLEFENRFRGDPQAIADRQRFYVDLFRGANRPVVDIGCGRGEFLGLLTEAGIPCYGIDRHPDMAAVCRDKGFEVVEADSLEHLAGLDEGSLGGIFCAQMVEHLATSEVPGFFQVARDALAVGSPFVVETINPESLFVFAHAFYVDLGHLRPLHPLTLEFLAHESGFSSVKVEYLSIPPDDFRPQPLPRPEGNGGGLSELVESLDENFRRIDDILFGPQDFAVIAHR